jgi:8-oxo-dGTP diphosphatase
MDEPVPEWVQNAIKYGPRPSLTVDGIVVIENRLVLIQRKNEPFKGMWALPGGFVEFKERVEDAVVREMEEETGLKTRVHALVGVYSDPDRDPRGHTVSAVFHLEKIGGELRAASDAKNVDLFSLDELPELAFDHSDIVDDFKKMR